MEAAVTNSGVLHVLIHGNRLNHSVILERTETLRLKDNLELIFEVKPQSCVTL
jgi:hypothetical protein